MGLDSTSSPSQPQFPQTPWARRGPTGETQDGVAQWEVEVAGRGASGGQAQMAGRLWDPRCTEPPPSNCKVGS